MPISPPPRDASGKIAPHDHDEIDGADRIIRRVSDEYIVDGPIPGAKRISSMAYQPSTGEGGGMSIDLEKLIVELGYEPKAFVTSPRFIGSVLFHAKDLREQGLMVGYDPLPDNKCHGEVWGRFSRGVKKALQKKATWFVEIEGVCLA